MKFFDVPTRTRDQFVNITAQVQQAVQAAGVTEGVVTVFVPHTTCGLTINENADPHVVSDMLKQLEVMVPQRQPFYEHSEGNSAAHIKASLMGCSLQVLVTCGHLELGVWQGIYLCEFDGPRSRRVWVG
ncbi:MAG TPA: secondary thiamine-phosphate synthase enzyme YjbQ [Kiritimatiellia bacterium]|nr:secondary thiamine-phosphate synthase enzyme YjbQ [Kiritimatiellia bacterium]HPS09020.1 secondary thiamine-phosphate synthase enzyme YjbQ [Kiritimatiellia bacterium]